MKLKIIGLIVLLLVLLIFALQNIQTVTLRFLFWQTETSTVLSILFSFLIGFLVGWLIRFGKPPQKPTPQRF
jgi:uncharacterized integral membrane protein